MIKLFTLLFFTSTLGMFTNCSSAKKSGNEANMVITPEVADNGKSLLWEISGNELTQSSFLFGTIHMINAEDYLLPVGTLTAIDVADKVVFEIDMADMEDPMKLMPLLQKAFMKGDTTLKDLMSVDEYALVKDHFKKMGLPIFLLERIKPMFLTVFASGDFDPNDLQNGKIKSYEMEFAAMASESNKETAGLETIEFQISVFDGIPYKKQADMLVETINSGSTEDDIFKELVDLYKAQDIAGLYALMKEDESIADYEDALLNNRNKNWIPIMKKMMSEQCTFFAVGAGHLGGPEGVISLLREAGYKVKPFKGA